MGLIKQLAYILTLLSHILQQDNTRGKVFLQLESKDLIQTFSRIWGRDNLSSYITGKAAICAALILSQAYAFEMAKNKNVSIDEKTQELQQSRSIQNSQFAQDYKSLCEWMLREFKKKNDKLLPSLYALKVGLSALPYDSMPALLSVCVFVWHMRDANLRIFFCWLCVLNVI